MRPRALPTPRLGRGARATGTCSRRSLLCQMPAILVSSLHKEFDERKEFLLGRKIKKVVTKHVSLCVKKGWSSMSGCRAVPFTNPAALFKKMSIYNHLSDLMGPIIVCRPFFRRDTGFVRTQRSWEKHVN